MSFKILMEILNAILKILNKHNFKIYDVDDKKYFLNKITYDKTTDKIFFECEEEI